MKYKDTMKGAAAYNQTKNTTTKTCACSDCGAIVPMNGESCVAFGVYACSICRETEGRPEKVRSPWLSPQTTKKGNVLK